MKSSIIEAATTTSRTRRRSDEPPIAALAVPPPTDAIARRAYELFLERGSTHGDDLADWLRAEQELAIQPVTAGAPTIES